MAPSASAASSSRRNGGVAASAALSTNGVVAALAGEGVGVYATPKSRRPLDRVSSPAVPIRVLRSQAAAFASETSTGAGVSGASLDGLVPMPRAPGGKQFPSFDYLLAAYASGHSTPGERVAHRLLAGANLSHPDTVVFPNLVLTLLSADVYRAGKAKSSSARIAAADQPLAHSAASGSLCSTLSDWVSAGFNSLVKSLTVGRPPTPH